MYLPASQPAISPHHLSPYLLPCPVQNVERQAAIESDMERKAVLQARIAELGPDGFGQRSVVPALDPSKLVHGFYRGPELIAPRSKAMKVRRCRLE